MRTHAIAGLAALFALVGCSTSFDGPEEVKGLRVLAVQAEPPEIGAPADQPAGGTTPWPAGGAAIRTLVGHPAFTAGDSPGAVVLHLACTPVPGDVQGTACTQMTELANPSELLRFVSPESACADPGLGEAGAITYAGLEACGRAGCGQLSLQRDPADPGSMEALETPTYRLPADYSLAALPAGHLQRVLGQDVVEVALALEATPADVAPPVAVPPGCPAVLPAVLQRFLELWTQRPHVASLKWIHARGPDMSPDSPPNHNPQIAGITLGGAALPAAGGDPLGLADRSSRNLLPVLPPGTTFEELREQYRRYDTDAKPIDTKLEDWSYSWFVTAGELDHSNTYAWDEANAFTPASGRALVWLVVRDLRGGMVWTSGEVEAP